MSVHRIEPAGGVAGMRWRGLVGRQQHSARGSVGFYQVAAAWAAGIEVGGGLDRWTDGGGVCMRQHQDASVDGWVCASGVGVVVMLLLPMDCVHQSWRTLELRGQPGAVPRAARALPCASSGSCLHFNVLGPYLDGTLLHSSCGIARREQRIVVRGGRLLQGGQQNAPSQPVALHEPPAARPFWAGR